MRLEQLPAKIRLLAMQRISEQGKVPKQELDIRGQFTFAETPEGHSYWREITLANFVDPIEYKIPQPKGSKIIIKFRNDLWKSSEKFSNSSL